MKKSVALSLCAILALAIVFTVPTTIPAQAANIQEVPSGIKVFIGNTETMTAKEAKQYNRSQAEQLEKLAKETPMAQGKALVTFDDFLTPQEAAEKLETAGNITKVYIWMPGKDGRSIIYVKDNDIEETIRLFFASLELDKEEESEYKNDMIELMKNYGVFAVEVADEFSDLKVISEKTDISRVDLMRSEEAEGLSARKNKEISYICIPEKPDGTK